METVENVDANGHVFRSDFHWFPQMALPGRNMNALDISLDGAKWYSHPSKTDMREKKDVMQSK